MRASAEQYLNCCDFNMAAWDRGYEEYEDKHVVVCGVTLLFEAADRAKRDPFDRERTPDRPANATNSTLINPALYLSATFTVARQHLHVDLVHMSGYTRPFHRLPLAGNDDPECASVRKRVEEMRS
jgi:hypothetical protein